MAAQSLRSRRNPRRTHGIHSLPKTLLLRLQRPPSQTMIFSLLFCECRRWFTPSAFREPSLVYAGRFLRGSTRLPCSFSATGHLCLRVLSSLCVLCVNSFFFLSSSRAQTLDNPLHSIDDEITAFSFGPNDAIAFSSYHKLKTKLYDLEHDDICIDEPHGKRHHRLSLPSRAGSLALLHQNHAPLLRHSSFSLRRTHLSRRRLDSRDEFRCRRRAGPRHVRPAPFAISRHPQRLRQGARHARRLRRRPHCFSRPHQNRLFHRPRSPRDPQPFESPPTRARARRPWRLSLDFRRFAHFPQAGPREKIRRPRLVPRSPARRRLAQQRYPGLAANARSRSSRPQLPRILHLSRRPAPRRCRPRQAQPAGFSSPTLKAPPIRLAPLPYSGRSLLRFVRLRQLFLFCVSVAPCDSLFSPPMIMAHKQNARASVPRGTVFVGARSSLSPLPVFPCSSSLSPHPAPPMLNQNAGILDHRQSRRSGPLCRLFVLDSQLHPHHLRSHANRALYHRRHLFRSPENIHDIYVLRHVLQPRITFLPQHFRLMGINRNNSIPRALHVLRHFVARPHRVRRQSNHRNRLVLAQNARNRIAAALRPKLRPFRNQHSHRVVASLSPVLCALTFPRSALIPFPQKTTPPPK